MRIREVIASVQDAVLVSGSVASLREKIAARDIAPQAEERMACGCSACHGHSGVYGWAAIQAASGAGSRHMERRRAVGDCDSEGRDCQGRVVANIS